MTDYMYLCYEIHPTDLTNGDLFWGFTKSGISLHVCTYVRGVGMILSRAFVLNTSTTHDISKSSAVRLIFCFKWRRLAFLKN